MRLILLVLVFVAPVGCVDGAEMARVMETRRAPRVSAAKRAPSQGKSFAVRNGLVTIQRGAIPARQADIDALSKLGARFELEKDPSGKPDVVGVTLSGKKVTDAAMRHLAGLMKLRRLIVHDADITDAGLEPIAGLSSLEKLFLTRTNVSEAAPLKSLTNLRSLSITGDKLTDAAVSNVRGMTKLRMLILDCSQITDSGLAALAGLKELRTLSLQNCQITDAGLARLAGLSGLRALCLNNCKITDAGLGTLKSFSRLQLLSVGAPQVTDDGLKHLMQLASLERLYLFSPQFSDNGLANIKGLVNLQTLYLGAMGQATVEVRDKWAIRVYPRDMKVTDAGLANIKPLKKLAMLGISGANVTDEGLAQLKELTNLGYLNLDRTYVTGAGVKKLQAALPECRISNGASRGVAVSKPAAPTKKKPSAREQDLRRLAKVKAMCDKAAKYLASPDSRKAPQMRHSGGPALLAYALLKYGQRYGLEMRNHPRLVEARKLIQDVARSKRKLVESDNYQLSIALIFMLEDDAKNNRPKYAAEIKSMLVELQSRQRPDGAWSYQPRFPTGDTSQTQFAVLALFTAKRLGYEVPTDRFARVCNWLLRTQDPTGSWGYQGQDPGIGKFDRVDQSEDAHAMGNNKANHNKAHSVASAGLGTLYLTANLLQFTTQDGQKPAVRLRPLTRRVDGNMLLRRMGEGDGWFNVNYSIPTERWQYYYLFSFERYQAFKELREGRMRQNTARWYDDGVNFLASRQKADGSWRGRRGGPAVDTSLAILFLVRNTKMVLESMDQAGPMHESPLGNQLRTWTDSTGKFTVKATFVRIDGTDVVLRRENRRELRVPIARLSKADRELLSRTKKQVP